LITTIPQVPPAERPTRAVSVRPAVLLAPALTAAVAFRAGGFFPAVTAWTAVALCLALVLHITLAARPFAGWSRALTVAAGALALLAAWTFLSGEWSHAPARALPEFDRVLAYLLVVVLAGASARRPGDLAALLRWTAIAIGLICLAAVLTRLLPATLPTDPGFDADRLAFPLTYWNAVGVLAAVGLVLLLGISCSAEQPRWARVLAAGLLPVVAAALVLTLSRGGIAAALLGLTLYCAIGHPRALAVVLPAVAAPTGVLVAVVLGSERLMSEDFDTAAAAGERSRVLVALVASAVAAGALRAAGLRAERRLAALRSPARRRTLAFAAICAAAALAAIAVAVGLPDRIEAQRRAFVEGDVVPVTANPADRLSQVGNNGRLAQWRVAVDRFEEEPLLGTGAGTYRLAWERARPAGSAPAVDGHSLYLETLAELGVPGLVLLALALAALLGALARGIGGPEHDARAPLLAAAVALLVHAGIDWDWEMPALWIWLLAAGGLAAASAAPAAGRRPPPRMGRVVAALALLVVALTPWSVARSESALAASVNAFTAGDCRTASDAALDSLEALDVRAEPLEILGYCNIRARRADLAIGSMRAAGARDPAAWQYAYGLAVAQAIAGQDPRPAAAEALSRNPLDERARSLASAFRDGKRREWPRTAMRAAIPLR
jgi:hypothetical protein